MEPIINKVAESGLVTLDLAGFVPEPDTIVPFDLKPFLFREMILREKDYRASLQAVEWHAYEGKHVALHCSADAIIPVWAYMLAASYLQPVSAMVYYGTEKELTQYLICTNIQKIDASAYEGKRVVIKGCGDKHIPESAYVAITQLLVNKVRSLMYGEPCSTVPIYKKASNTASAI